MKSLIIILLCTTVYICEIKSQPDYQDGYLITYQFDTIYGKIDNRNYYENSQFCDFKEIGADTVIRYYPHNLYGYKFIDGKYYISKTILIDKKNVQVFMEYLIKGKLNIYFFQDQEGTNRYFIAKDTLQLHELRFSEGVMTIDGRQMYYQTKQYIGLLDYYTADCPEIKNDLKNFQMPNHKNLIKFSKKYHDLTCNDDQCIIYEKKIPKKIKANILNGTNYFFSQPTNLNRQLYYSFGFNILFQQALRRENLYLGIGFYYEGKINSSRNLYRLPFSVNYLNSKNGFSPVASYEFDLNYLAGSQSLKFGIKYQMKKVALNLISDIKTSYVILPYASAIHLGLLYDLR